MSSGQRCSNFYKENRNSSAFQIKSSAKVPKSKRRVAGHPASFPHTAAAPRPLPSKKSSLCKVPAETLLPETLTHREWGAWALGRLDVTHQSSSLRHRASGSASALSLCPLHPRSLRPRGSACLPLSHSMSNSTTLSLCWLFLGCEGLGEPSWTLAGPAQTRKEFSMFS